jgi:murein DD-endopeptidase MepM/ murein hydrolase activator NlpD
VSLLAVGALWAASAAAAEDELDGEDLQEFEREDLEAGCDASAGGEDIAELLADQPRDVTIPTPLPTVWRESAGRQCRRYHGRRACDGPRRVPAPHGPAAELARQLGLDDEARVARTLMTGTPPPEWRSADPTGPSAGLLWPVPDGRLWRGMGMRRTITRVRGQRRRVMHNGVDIGAAEGSPIRAANDALVVYSNNGMRGYGNVVLLLHADGTITLYGHCRATYVFAGERVQRGQVIAEVGETGLAHGPHLHFEWRRDGRPLDPLPHFVGWPGARAENEIELVDAP